MPHFSNPPPRGIFVCRLAARIFPGRVEGYREKFYLPPEARDGEQPLANVTAQFTPAAQSC